MNAWKLKHGITNITRKGYPEHLSGSGEFIAVTFAILAALGISDGLKGHTYIANDNGEMYYDKSSQSEEDGGYYERDLAIDQANMGRLNNFGSLVFTETTAESTKSIVVTMSYDKKSELIHIYASYSEQRSDGTAPNRCIGKCNADTDQTELQVIHNLYSDVHQMMSKLATLAS